MVQPIRTIFGCVVRPELELHADANAPWTLPSNGRSYSFTWHPNPDGPMKEKEEKSCLNAVKIPPWRPHPPRTLTLSLGQGQKGEKTDVKVRLFLRGKTNECSFSRRSSRSDCVEVWQTGIDRCIKRTFVFVEHSTDRFIAIFSRTIFFFLRIPADTIFLMKRIICKVLLNAFALQILQQLLVYLSHLFVVFCFKKIVFKNVVYRSVICKFEVKFINWNCITTANKTTISHNDICNLQTNLKHCL